MAVSEVGTDGGGGSTSGTITGLTPTSGRLHLILIGVEDADEDVLSSIDGTNGWAIANGATYGTIHTSTGTNVSHSFVYCVPGSSTSGNIDLTFAAAPSRWQAFVLDWDDGETSSPINTTDITHQASAASAANPTHPAMDDGTNNVLVCFITIAQDDSANLTQDTNYTESTSSPIAFESDGGAAMGVCWITGDSDLTCNWSWVTFMNYIATIFEVAKASGEAGANLVPIMQYHQMVRNQ